MIPAEQDILIRDMARQFAQERLKPFAADWDREHRFPAEALKEMADLGFLGTLVPEEWGGAQTGHLAYAMALEEIAAGDGACSTIMSVHNSVGCMPILKFGSQEQKERFLQPLASGGRAGSPAVVVQHQLGQRLGQSSAQRELRLHACGKFWRGRGEEGY